MKWRLKMKKLIAKAVIGKEYLHSKQNTFFASDNAQKIVDILNKSKYKLNDGECWHVYDYDFMQDTYTEQRIYITNKGAIKATLI
jgi:hypothetical protein